ncbi:hypothetical protein TNCV_2716171 [Trichonephila clavipes]|nr:hypothetical protein TNCV_2716171 [Trichonephila clavipes]
MFPSIKSIGVQILDFSSGTDAGNGGVYNWSFKKLHTLNPGVKDLMIVVAIEQHLYDQSELIRCNVVVVVRNPVAKCNPLIFFFIDDWHKENV